ADERRARKRVETSVKHQRSVVTACSPWPARHSLRAASNRPTRPDVFGVGVATPRRAVSIGSFRVGQIVTHLTRTGGGREGFLATEAGCTVGRNSGSGRNTGAHARGDYTGQLVLRHQ